MFNNIIGNDKIKDILSNTVLNNKISHSYLFIGTEGIGKKLIAEEFAKIILKQDIVNNPDFKIIEPDDKSLKIDQIREFQSKVSEKPIVSERKVYIINDSDKMTTEAQNCLLKTLEEPPEFVTIILIGSNENAFLSTIKSRCMIIHFEPLSNDQIKTYLKENYNIDVNDDIMISAFEGSIGKAIKINENIEEYLKVEKLINSINSNTLVFVLNNSEVLYKNKEIIYDLLEYISILLFNSKKIKNINCIKYVEEAKTRLSLNSNYDMTIDNMLIKMWEEVNEKYSRS